MAFDDVFAELSDRLEPLLGKPTWQVCRGIGSFLTLEFGDPYVTIGEPRARRTSDSVPGMRRLVTLHGNWHLWIQQCDWSISQGEQELANSGSPDASIDHAAGVLLGQALTGVAVNPRSAATTFEFDLGGVLATQRSDKESEQWCLFTPDADVLTLWADARVELETHSRGEE